MTCISCKNCIPREATIRNDEKCYVLMCGPRNKLINDITKDETCWKKELR